MEVSSPSNDVEPAVDETSAVEAPWTTDDANELYLIDRWGSGYFEVGADGSMQVAPLRDRGRKISIYDVVQAAIKDENLKTPVLLRFQDILHHRVKTLNDAFNAAIVEERYRGTYRGFSPIKVNQLR